MTDKVKNSVENPMIFSFSKSSRTVADWRSERIYPNESVWAIMRRWARDHGAAGAWRANDSYRLFYHENGKIRQKSWRYSKPIKYA